MARRSRRSLIKQLLSIESSFSYIYGKPHPDGTEEERRDCAYYEAAAARVCHRLGWKLPDGCNYPEDPSTSPDDLTPEQIEPWRAIWYVILQELAFEDDETVEWMEKNKDPLFPNDSYNGWFFRLDHAEVPTRPTIEHLRSLPLEFIAENNRHSCDQIARQCAAEDRGEVYAEVRPKNAVQIDAYDKNILGFLAKSGVAEAQADIAVAVGLDRKTINRRLPLLRALGYVVKAARGESITDQGRDLWDKCGTGLPRIRPT